MKALCYLFEFANTLSYLGYKSSRMRANSTIASAWKIYTRTYTKDRVYILTIWLIIKYEALPGHQTKLRTRKALLFFIIQENKIYL